MLDTDARVDLLACQRLGVRSMLAVPLSAKQSVIGLLEAFSNEPYGFNDSDVRSLNLLVELILSALRPEEEDRLTEISQRVVPQAVDEPRPIPVIAPEIVKAQTEPPPEKLDEKAGAERSVEGSPEHSAENSEFISKNFEIERSCRKCWRSGKEWISPVPALRLWLPWCCSPWVWVRDCGGSLATMRAW